MPGFNVLLFAGLSFASRLCRAAKHSSAGGGGGPLGVLLMAAATAWLRQLMPVYCRRFAAGCYGPCFTLSCCICVCHRSQLILRQIYGIGGNGATAVAAVINDCIGSQGGFNAKGGQMKNEKVKKEATDSACRLEGKKCRSLAELLLGSWLVKLRQRCHFRRSATETVPQREAVDGVYNNNSHDDDDLAIGRMQHNVGR